MQRANEYGVYEAEQTEELARVGRAYAAIEFCQCESDGLYRYALDMAYSYGGFCGPISDQRDGFKTCHAAKDAAGAGDVTAVPERIGERSAKRA